MRSRNSHKPPQQEPVKTGREECPRPVAKHQRELTRTPWRALKAGGSSPHQVGSGGRLRALAAGAGHHGSSLTVSSGTHATHPALKKRIHCWSDWLKGAGSSWMIALKDVLLMLAAAGLSGQPIQRGSAAAVAARSRRNVQMPGVVQVAAERSSAGIRHQRIAAVLSAADALPSG